MSDDEINIAIAEACGWTIFTNGSDRRGDWHVKRPGYTGAGYTTGHAVPEYTSDLNAMHEAEKVLEHEPVCGGDFGSYLDTLVDLACANPSHPSGYTTAVTATARQRAEAFLRTIDKWKEAA